MMFTEATLRKLERLAILTRQAVRGQMQGERRSRKRGQSVEFADFRPYAPGDDFRRIDWNVYARLERFFIKLFVEEEDITVHLLLDTSESMKWGTPSKLAYAKEAAGALGYIGLAGLDRVTMTALTSGSNSPTTLTPRRGKQQAYPLFRFLETVAEGGQVDLVAGLRSYVATHRQAGPLVLFSDLMDERWEEGLRALAGHQYEVTVLHVLAPDEVEPTITGDVRLLDSETRASVEITADYDLLQRYRDSLREWQQDIRRFCSARGMHYIPVETSLPFDELLFSLMRRRGVLR